MKDKRTSSKDDFQNNSMKQSLFLSNLEQWIEEVISQDELTDRELIKTIKEKFGRTMQANIQYHKFMMYNAKENNDKKRADHHKLMAEIYQSLL